MEIFLDLLNSFTGLLLEFDERNAVNYFILHFVYKCEAIITQVHQDNQEGSL